MKLKIWEREVKQKETQYELPLYFYIQGDFLDSEWIKIEQNKKITITQKLNTYNISIENSIKDRKGIIKHDVTIVEPYYLNNFCTKEEFEEQLKYIKNQL